MLINRFFRLFLLIIAVFTIFGCATTPQHVAPSQLREANEAAMRAELLEKAAFNGNLPEVQRLIAEGADVNAKPSNVYPALVSASMRCHKEVVELLLAKGADVSAKANDGRALVFALENGCTPIVQLLIASGADVNARGEGHTALIFASVYGNAETVQLLIAKGADVNAKDTGMGQIMGIGPIHGTALIYASIRGYKEVVQALLDKGADVNAKSNDGWTALMWASKYGRKEVVQALLDKGADVNVNVTIVNSAYIQLHQGPECSKVILSRMRVLPLMPLNSQEPSFTLVESKTKRR